MTGAKGGKLGAMMVTPPKALSKMGARREGGEAKGLEKQTSSLDEIMEDMRAERRKKIREKEKFEESGWRRIEDIAKWQWTYYKVPSDKKELVIDMEGQERGNISRLKIFSLYFSDELLSFITSKQESVNCASRFCFCFSLIHYSLVFISNPVIIV